MEIPDLRVMLMEEDETQETDTVEAEQPETPEDDPRRKLEGLAARVLELEDSLKAEKGTSDEYYRRLQYLQADFENYRKRAEKEMGEVKRTGNERLLSDLLLVNDELELALQRARDNNESPALLEGVGMVHKRLQGLLAKEGIQRITGVGSKFNPDLHDAALRVPSERDEGTIIEEIRPGYLLKGRVLRPSIVKVAEKQASEEAKTDQEGEE